VADSSSVAEEVNYHQPRYLHKSYLVFSTVGQTPIRSTSPLPPNVPTGPRNQNKYKDRDGLTANVDGLDYGGGGGRDANNNTPPEERSR
jgi:hypothetical protein